MTQPVDIVELTQQLLPPEIDEAREGTTDWLGKTVENINTGDDYIDAYPLARNITKGVIVIASAVSKAAFWTINMRAGEVIGGGNALGIPAALANCAAFFVLEVRSGFDLLNDEVGPKTRSELELQGSKNNNRTRQIVLLVPAVGIAALSQLPSFLASEEYNSANIKTLLSVVLWATLTLFPLRSVQLSLEAATKMKLDHLERSLLASRSAIQANLISDNDSQPAFNPGQNIAHKVGKCAGAAIGVFFLGNIAIYTENQTYKHTHNKGLAVSAGISAFTSTAYLTFNAIVATAGLTSLRVFNLFTGQKTLNLAERLRPKLAILLHTAGGIIDILALGAVIVIYSDFDDKDKGERVAGGTIMATGLFFLLFNSMLEKIDDLILTLISYRGETYEKQMVKTYYKLKEVRRAIQKSSALDAAIHLLDLPEGTRAKLLGEFDIALDKLVAYVKERKPAPRALTAESTL